MDIFNLNYYNRPLNCTKCGGVMIYKGLGEYQCEQCKESEFDDYGKVRNYVEKNVGASVANISEETGVSRKSINNMIKEGRFEITQDSRTFMKCEGCGVDIRSGRFCPKCEAEYHRRVEAAVREQQKHDFKGVHIKGDEGQDGSIRYFNMDKGFGKGKE